MLDAAATLGDLHRRNLRLRADALALIFEDRRISHRELIGEACRLANAVIDALAAVGVRHIEMPYTPARVWRAIQYARGNAGG